MVPTHEHAELAHARGNRREAQVARGEIIFFVESGVIRNVHLAVHSRHTAVFLEHYSRVVVEPRCAALEKAANEHDMVFFGNRAKAAHVVVKTQRIVEERLVLALAKILCRVQLLEQHQISSRRDTRNRLARGFYHRFARARVALLHER